MQRSAKECEIRWLGERHPQFNNSQWTQPEIAKVKQLVATANEGEVDWVEIAKKLGVRAPCSSCSDSRILNSPLTDRPDVHQSIAFETLSSERLTLGRRRRTNVS